MKRITKEEAFSRGLPKWPQLKLTGECVTEAQAKDILARTDSFVTGLSEYCGGNNKRWNEWALGVLGFAPLFEFSKHCYGEDRIEGFSNVYYGVLEDIRKELQFVSTEYVNNSWMSSAFIFGPHGWCSPQGVLAYSDNVGKWPSVEEVYNDFKTIVKAFPYVNLTATLMSGEGCEDETHPVVTFVVRGGRVAMTDEHEAHHHKTVMPDRSDAAMEEQMKSLMFSNSREQGVPQAWIVEMGDKFRPVTTQALQKLAEFVADSKVKQNDASTH